MATNMDVTARLRLDSQQFDRGLRLAVDNTKNFAQKSERSFDRVHRSAQKLSSVGKTLTMRLTLPLAAVGGAAIKVASDFEKSMTSITALVGIAADEVKAMEGDVRSMAVEFGKSGSDAADAMFFIQSAGLRGADAMDTLEASLKASAIGLGDTAVIADLATSALNAYGSDTLSATQATDVMTAAVREGKLQADELAGSMGRVLPVASAMGVGFDEVGAAFAALSRTGTNASEAATQIRGILASLLRPTKQAKDQLAELGLSAEGLRAQIREKGLLSTLGTLVETFGDNEEAAATVFGNIRALSGVMDLMGANVATTEAIFASMADTTGAVDKAFEAVSKTTSFQFQQTLAELKDALLELGQAILPTVNGALQVIGDVVSSVTGWFSGLSDGTRDMIVAMGGILAIAGPLAIGVGALAAAFTALGVAAAPVAALIGAGTIAGGLWFAAAMEQKRRTEELKDELLLLDDALVTTVPHFQQLIDTVAATLPENTIDTIKESLSAFAGQATLDAALIESGMSGTFDKIGFDLDKLGEQLRDGDGSFGEFGQHVEAALQRVAREQTIAGQQVMTHAEQIEFFKETLVAETGTLSESEKALMDYVIANGLSADSVSDLIKDLDTLQDTFHDVRKENEEAAKAELTNAETISVLNAAFDGKARKMIEDALATADAEERTDRYTYALEVLSAQLDDVAAAEDLAAGYASYGASRMLEYVDASVLAAEVANAHAGELQRQAELLVMAGEAAGYDALMIQNLVRDLGILDQLDPKVAVALGLDVIGGESILKMIDSLIKLQIGDKIVGQGFYDMFPEIKALVDLRSALSDQIAEGNAAGASSYSTGSGGLQFSGGVPGFDSSGIGGGAGVGGGSAAQQAQSEADRLAEQAAREAERAAAAAQAQIDQLAGSVYQTAQQYMGRDWAMGLFNGTSESIREAFRQLQDEMADISIESGKSTMFMAAQAMRLQFDQLANLADNRDKLQAELDAINAVKSQITGMFADHARLDYIEGGSSGSYMYQAKRKYVEAQNFVQAVTRLQAKGVAPAILQDVVNAGIVQGTAMANEISKMSESDLNLLSLYTGRTERMGQNAARIAGITLGEDRVQAGLDGTTDAMERLTNAIQFDLADTFDNFIRDLPHTLTNLSYAPEGVYSPGASLSQGSNTQINITAPVGSSGADIGAEIVRYLNEYASSGGGGLNVSLVN